MYDTLKDTFEFENVFPKVDRWQVSRMVNGFPQSGLQHDWKFFMGMWLLLVFPITYFITSLKSSIAIREKKLWRRPPIMPYWIPFLGNLFPLLWDPFGFFSMVPKTYGYSIPVRLRLGPFKLHLVSDADHYVTIFNNKASRHMNTKAAVLLSLKNLFGTPTSIIPFYAADNSGTASTPLPGSNVKPEHRITYLQVKAAHKHLSGPALVQMTETFLSMLEQRIQKSQVGSNWVDQPDLYELLRCEVFSAAVEALCGSYLLSQSPTFVEDFWEFVSSVPTLVKGLPQWMSPKPYRVRRRLLDAIKKWHTMAHRHSDCSRTGTNDPEWEPYFGSKLMRTRQEYARGMDFMNADALAAEDLGLIFATNTNAIPSLTWFIFEICRDPDLKERVQQEIRACRASPPGTDEVRLDINKLCSQPLLQSIYAETLRLRVALIVTRTPEHEDFKLGEWTFPANQLIALSSRAGGMNPNLWNSGTPKNPHPLDSFWADRFLIYPNDPTSGPLRKDLADERKIHYGDHAAKEKSSEEGPRFSMDGVAGGWIPYGGGQRMCPGRHFAKQEIIGTLAMLLTHYDIELRLPANSVPECDMGFFPFGGLPPTIKIPFRMRRRKCE